jgi:hypothetical protein
MHSIKSHICSASLTLLLNFPGNGFKLFRVSSTENENEQVPPKISTTNTNWFLSIFATHKRKTTTEQGNAVILSAIDSLAQ